MLRRKDSVITIIIIAIGVDLSIILEEVQPLQLNAVFGQIPYLAYLSSSGKIPLTETNTIDSDTSSNSSSVSGYNSNTKVVIINFDDSYKSQYVYAKPILDKYGFKATFFEVCNWIGAQGSGDNTKMTWQDIAELYNEGYDVEL